MGWQGQEQGTHNEDRCGMAGLLEAGGTFSAGEP
jgi:hypothetical protein